MDVETQQGIDKVRITISGINDVFYSDADGNYSIDGVSGGSQVISVKATGYAGDSSTILSQTVIDFNLLRVVPVILYHNISYNQASIYRISPDHLHDHLAYLARHNFQSLTIAQLLSFVKNEGTVPRRSFVLTFDDNETGIYENGLPLMAKHGFYGISFVQTGSVGSSNHCSWSDLQAMENSGLFAIESHSVTHPAMTQLSEADIIYQLTASKQAIEDNLSSKTCQYFAYPYGDENETVRSLTESAGYLAAFDASSNGLNKRGSPIYRLPRATYLDINSFELFLEKINAWDPHLPEDPIIVDDQFAYFSPASAWNLNSYSGGNYFDNSYGTTYRSKPASNENAFVRWTPLLPDSGHYKVYAWWHQNDANVTQATYVISHFDGESLVNTSQRSGGGRWNLLGSFNFEKNQEGFVTLYDDGQPQGNTIIADAIKFELELTPTPTPVPCIKSKYLILY